MFWTFTFWVVMIYVANSAMGLARSIVDYDWYAARMMRRGVEPNLKRLLIVRAVTLTTGVFIVCWVGAKAGYL